MFKSIRSFIRMNISSLKLNVFFVRDLFCGTSPEIALNRFASSWYFENRKDIHEALVSSRNMLSCVFPRDADLLDSVIHITGSDEALKKAMDYHFPLDGKRYHYDLDAELPDGAVVFEEN